MTKAENKKNHSARLFFLLIFIPVFLWCKTSEAESSEFHFLFYDPEWGFSDSAEAMEHLSPFCEFIGETLSKTVSPLYLKKEAKLEAYLKKPDVLFGIINTSVVLKTYNMFDLEPLLLPVKNGKKQHRKMFIVPTSGKFSSIEELKGKRLAILSSDRHTLQRQISLIRSGNFVKPSLFFGSILDAASPGSAVLSVLFGLADSALTTSESLRLAEKENPALKDHVRILHSLPSMTYSPFVRIRKRTDSQQTKELQTALSSLHRTEAGKRLLALIYADAFEKTDLEDFANRNLAFYQKNEQEEEVSTVAGTGEQIIERQKKFYQETPDQEIKGQKIGQREDIRKQIAEKTEGAYQESPEQTAADQGHKIGIISETGQKQKIREQIVEKSEGTYQESPEQEIKTAANPIGEIAGTGQREDIRKQIAEKTEGAYQESPEQKIKTAANQVQKNGTIAETGKQIVVKPEKSYQESPEQEIKTAADQEHGTEQKEEIGKQEDLYQQAPVAGIGEKEELGEQIVEKLYQSKKEELISYRIQQGDTLSKLAKKFLGSGRKYRILMKINQIENPDLIITGQLINIPKTDKKE